MKPISGKVQDLTPKTVRQFLATVGQPPKTYRQQLQDCYEKHGVYPQDQPVPILDDESARNLHEDICRRLGMHALQIVQDWNRRSPEDDQW